MKRRKRRKKRQGRPPWIVKKPQVQQFSLDIQREIVSRLPASSILRLQSVCRDWHAMRHDPSIAVANLAHAKNTAHLAIHSGCGEQEQQVHLIEASSNGYAVSRLEPMPWNRKIIGSCNGVLCLREERTQYYDASEPLYLYNPLLGGAYLRLPDHPTIPLFSNVNYGFCFDSARSEFQVVIFIDDRGNDDGPDESLLFIKTCTIPVVGDHIGTPRSWKAIKSDIHIEGFFNQIQLNPLILLNGKLHGRLNKKVITSFDIKSEEIASIDLDFLGYISSWNLRIGELGGYLCATYILQNMETVELWVMKDYGDPQSWTKQFSLRGHTFERSIITPYMFSEDDIFLLLDKFHPLMVNYTPSLLSLPQSYDKASAYASLTVNLNNTSLDAIHDDFR